MILVIERVFRGQIGRRFAIEPKTDLIFILRSYGLPGGGSFGRAGIVNFRDLEVIAEAQEAVVGCYIECVWHNEYRGGFG